MRPGPVMDTGVEELPITELLKISRRAILFGAGQAGIEAARLLREKDLEILFFCDNDVKKHGKRVEGVEVFSSGKLKRHKDEIVLISSEYGKEIGMQLRRLGVKRFYFFGYCSDFDRWYRHFDPAYIRGSLYAIGEACDAFEDDYSRAVFTSLLRFRLTGDPSNLAVSRFKEYFHPEVGPRPGDVIIDGGAWVGDTAISFSEYLGGKCKVFSFEPDARNFEVLLDNIERSGLRNIVIPVQSGLWRHGGVVRFKGLGKNSSQFRISEDGEKEIEVVSLDEFIGGNKHIVNLIKMDIEGSERDAVKGAERTISRDRPRLQICVYHRVDDLWKIPLLIKSMNPGYKLFIAHHTQNLFGTVLYAV